MQKFSSFDQALLLINFHLRKKTYSVHTWKIIDKNIFYLNIHYYYF